jgi:hypothetical protein
MGGFMEYNFTWIPVADHLPEERKEDGTPLYVLIWCGSCQIARIKKGISEEDRAAMKRGELHDPDEYGWSASTGTIKYKRSDVYRESDVCGNNLVPYHWFANGGPMNWFGQDVTHWAYLPDGPVNKTELNKAE